MIGVCGYRSTKKITDMQLRQTERISASASERVRPAKTAALTTVCCTDAAATEKSTSAAAAAAGCIHCPQTVCAMIKLFSLTDGLRSSAQAAKQCLCQTSRQEGLEVPGLASSCCRAAALAELCELFFAIDSIQHSIQQLLQLQLQLQLSLESARWETGRSHYCGRSQTCLISRSGRNISTVVH